jgi:hypothetical protein
MPSVARDASHFDECGDWIIERGDRIDQIHHLDVFGEPGPALKPVFASQNQLRIGTFCVLASKFGFRQLMKPRMVPLETGQRTTLAAHTIVDQILGLFLVLLQAGAGG